MPMKVKLLRPLDGREPGTIVEYSDVDANRLIARGAVALVSGKAASAPQNKMEPVPENKDITGVPYRSKRV